MVEHRGGDTKYPWDWFAYNHGEYSSGYGSSKSDAKRRGSAALAQLRQEMNSDKVDEKARATPPTILPILAPLIDSLFPESQRSYLRRVPVVIDKEEIMYYGLVLFDGLIIGYQDGIKGEGRGPDSHTSPKFRTGYFMGYRAARILEEEQTPEVLEFISGFNSFIGSTVDGLEEMIEYGPQAVDIIRSMKVEVSNG